MNNRNILKAYALLQQMTPDELALLNLLRSLSEAEREQLIEIMGGNGPSSKKKAGKKSAGKSSSKSSRASGMAAAINRSLSQSDLPCAHILPDDNHCMELRDNPVHDPKGGYVTVHEYVPPAHRRSSTNGGATSIEVSSETGEVVVLSSDIGK